MKNANAQLGDVSPVSDVGGAGGVVSVLAGNETVTAFDGPDRLPASSRLRTVKVCVEPGCRWRTWLNGSSIPAYRQSPATSCRYSPSMWISCAKLSRWPVHGPQARSTECDVVRVAVRLTGAGGGTVSALSGVVMVIRPASEKLPLAS